jgi:hypothetical protein
MGKNMFETFFYSRITECSPLDIPTIFYHFSLDGNMRNSLNKGINYLAENWDSIDPKVNPHSLALVTYALHLALHPEKDQVHFNTGLWIYVCYLNPTY